MNFEMDSRPQRVLGPRITVAIAVAAVLLGMLALYRTNQYPRTDDAEVFANFIGIAPQVDGPILRLNVHDNQFVRKGELLFEIDERPYQYALEKAVSDQAALEGQITDEQRRIAALVSAVSGSQANVHSAQADTMRSAAAIDEARANVASAEQGVTRTKAEWSYAANNLHRLEPLLTKQFVTVDQVDQARTLEIAESEALKQAESQLRMSQAGLQSALAQYE
jgi:membrane fusion protein, multidrug efflux system